MPASFEHETIKIAGIALKRIPCYMRDSAWGCGIVKNAKIFSSYIKVILNIFEISRG